MNIFRKDLEPSYFYKSVDDLIYPQLFGEAFKVFLLNPSNYTPSAGQITSQAQLDSEKVEFSDNLIVSASDFTDSNWDANGWNLNTLDSELQAFADSNLVFEDNGTAEDLNVIIVRKTIDSVPYTVVFIYVGNGGGDGDDGDDGGGIITFDPELFMTTGTDGKFPNPFLPISAIAETSDGILIGGPFTQYNNMMGYDGLIKLDFEGNLDENFMHNLDSFEGMQLDIRAIAVQPDGRIIVGGSFENYGAAGRNNLIRLNSDGTLDEAFCANVSDSEALNGDVWDIKVLPNGNIVAVGSLSYQFNPALILMLSPSGVPDLDYMNVANIGIDGIVLSVDVYLDNRILVGGFFESNIRRIQTNGSTDTTLNISLPSGVTKVLIDSNENILVGGDKLYNPSNYNLVRYSPTGVLDETFTVNAGVLDLTATRLIALQNDGAILVFVSSGDINRRGLLRFSSDGILDSAFAVAYSDARWGDSMNPFVNAYALTVIRQEYIAVGGLGFQYGGIIGRDNLVIIPQTVEVGGGGGEPASYYTNAFDNPYQSWELFTDADNNLLSGGNGSQQVDLYSSSDPSQPGGAFFDLNVPLYEANVNTGISLTPFSSRVVVSIDINDYVSGNNSPASFSFVILDQSNSVVSSMVDLTSDGTYTLEINLSGNPLSEVVTLRVIFSSANEYGNINPSFNLLEIRVSVEN